MFYFVRIKSNNGFCFEMLLKGLDACHLFVYRSCLQCCDAQRRRWCTTQRHLTSLRSSSASSLDWYPYRGSLLSITVFADDYRYLFIFESHFDLFKRHQFIYSSINIENLYSALTIKILRGVQLLGCWPMTIAFWQQISQGSHIQLLKIKSSFIASQNRI